MAFVDILHETENVLCVNKPANLMVHGDGRTQEPTLVDWILKNFPEIKNVGEPMEISLKDETVIIPRPGIVHRLDKDTSGVMVIAKNQETFFSLKEQFQNKKIQKKYHAFVYEWPKEDFGEVNASIGRSGKDFRMWTAQRDVRGTLREAVTMYHTLERFTQQTSQKESDRESYALVAFTPKTGRTHQIRVHAKYMNHPIVADTLYGGKRAQKQTNLGFKRQALHAREITFTDRTGELVTVEAPYPDDFLNALDGMNK